MTRKGIRFHRLARERGAVTAMHLTEVANLDHPRQKRKNTSINLRKEKIRKRKSITTITIITKKEETTKKIKKPARKTPREQTTVTLKLEQELRLKAIATMRKKEVW